MRAFFLETLQNLDKTSGLKQYEKIMSGPEPKKEINALLDVLCRVSDQLSIIPLDAQKSIITQSVITDLELTSLNAKIVYKWLAMHKDKYFKESHHVQEDKQSAEPLTGEARAQALKKFLEAVQSVGQPQTITHVKELEQTLPKKPQGVSYTPSNGAQGFAEELFEMQQLRAEYARECRDLHTGKLLEGKPEFKDWINDKKI
jgi:hypothetical protein